MSATVTPNPRTSSWPTPATANPTAELVQETWALTRRLLIQLQRRPATLVAGIIQPLMWLILFGALFQNAPQGFFSTGVNYAQFLSAGIIVFTAFSGALNAGLPVMFDREFGFLNRFLVAPLVSRFSIILASTIFITLLSLVQTVAVILTSYFLGGGLPGVAGFALVVGIVMLLVLGMTALSLGLTFALPGHVELLAVIFVVNLPLLFASTALAPLDFMPDWLRTIASLNPLSYAIEPIRHLYLHPDWQWSDTVMVTPWGDLSLGLALVILALFDGLIMLSVRKLLQRKLS
ncbi:ABC transporter permease [Gloeomargarita lithophora]|uniref:ABC transporter permease n=1 Tax=Gloeomargarita lithophora TaxID=1188228 RepID=UPI003F720914